MPNRPPTNIQSKKVTARLHKSAGGNREVWPAEQKSPLLRAVYLGGVRSPRKNFMGISLLVSSIPTILQEGRKKIKFLKNYRTSDIMAIPFTIRARSWRLRSVRRTITFLSDTIHSSFTVWGGNLYKRFCYMFFASSPCLLGQHGSCTTACGTLGKHFTKPFLQVAAECT